MHGHGSDEAEGTPRSNPRFQLSFSSHRSLLFSPLLPASLCSATSLWESYVFSCEPSHAHLRTIGRALYAAFPSLMKRTLSGGASHKRLCPVLKRSVIRLLALPPAVLFRSPKKGCQCANQDETGLEEKEKKRAIVRRRMRLVERVDGGERAESNCGA